MTHAVQKEVLAHNLALIVEVLRQHNLARLTIDYAGSGDSGDTFEVAVFDAHDAAQPMPTAEVQGKRVISHYDSSISRETVLSVGDRPKPTPFVDFIEDFHCEVLSASNHQGFEDGEGGGGTLTITVEGTCSLEHYDYYVEKSESTTDFSELMPQLPAPVAPEPNGITLPVLVRTEPYCVEV
jgi:hypothetical protein